MKTAKRMLALLVVLTVIISTGQTVWAIEESPADDGIPTRYELTSRVTVDVSSSSAGKLSITLFCMGKSGTTGIKSSTTLERYTNGVWRKTTINGAAALTYSTTSSTLLKTQSVNVTAGTYRAVVTFTVSANGKTEIVTTSSESVRVN